MASQTVKMYPWTWQEMENYKATSRKAVSIKEPDMAKKPSKPIKKGGKKPGC
jgi:hypothetical protein